MANGEWIRQFGQSFVSAIRFLLTIALIALIWVILISLLSFFDLGFYIVDHKDYEARNWWAKAYLISWHVLGFAGIYLLTTLGIFKSKFPFGKTLQIDEEGRKISLKLMGAVLATWGWTLFHNMVYNPFFPETIGLQTTALALGFCTGLIVVFLKKPKTRRATRKKVE
jgi:hypothetical protein